MTGSPTNVYDILARSARNWPRRTALVDEFGPLDYQTLLLRVEETRERLARLGVREGHGVGVMGRNGRGCVISAFAALGCGAVVMLMPQRMKEAELDEMLEAAPLHAVIHDGPLAMRGVGRSSHGAGTLSGAADLGCDPLRFTWTEVDREKPFVAFVPDAAFVRFTSGTTGRSKGVALSHGDIFERTAAANRGLRLSDRDTVLWVLPMAYHFLVSIVLYLRYGCTIVICKDYLAETILADANRHDATFLYACPLHCRMLVAEGSGAGFRTLRRAVSTSMGLAPETAHAFCERFGFPVSQAYGNIEIGLPMINLDMPRERPHSVGPPLPDYEVALFDEDLRPVPEGDIGELAVRGPGMFSAYLSPPRLRKDVLREGWFLTGDLARRDGDGYVAIMGRCKSIINVGGEKVFPEEIEGVLNSHPLVLRSRVHGRPHPRLNEVAHANVMLRNGAAPPSADELIDHCRKRLSSLKIPQTVTFVDWIEETPSGKVPRR